MARKNPNGPDVRPTAQAATATETALPGPISSEMPRSHPGASGAAAADSEREAAFDALTEDLFHDDGTVSARAVAELLDPDFDAMTPDERAALLTPLAVLWAQSMGEDTMEAEGARLELVAWPWADRETHDHACSLTDETFQMHRDAPYPRLVFDLFNEAGAAGDDWATVHPRIVRQGEKAVRDALRAKAMEMLRDAAGMIAEANRYLQVALHPILFAWPDYWQQEEPARLRGVHPAKKAA